MVDVSALLAGIQSDPRQSRWQKQVVPTKAIPFETAVVSGKDCDGRHNLTTATSCKTGGGRHSPWSKSGKPSPSLNIIAVSESKWKTFDGKPIPFPTG